MILDSYNLEEDLKPKTLEAIKLLATMLVDHGLGDWHIHLKEVKSYHAQTFYKQKMIVWNIRSLRRAEKHEFIGISYHEIAHALVGPGNGHGRKFKLKYNELTGDWLYAKACSRLKYKHYSTECPECGHTDTSDKNGTRYCRPCANNGKRIQLNITSTIVGWEI